MGKTIELHITRANSDTTPHAPRLWQVIGDEDNPEFGNQSRTLTVVKRILEDGTKEYFDQLPAVYGYAWEPVPSPDNYRVNEEPLRIAYITLNNYDGDGYRRCVNYLFNDHSALYNGKGFPYRELLTMSGNLLEEIEWIQYNSAQYLKFRTLKPTDDVSGMTLESHPQFVHAFRLVYWDKAQKKTKYTITTPRGRIFFYLVSPDGFGIIPGAHVRSLHA